jgi:hypothetical protein
LQKTNGAVQELETRVWETQVSETEHKAECGHRKPGRFPVKAAVDHWKPEIAALLTDKLTELRELSGQHLPDKEYMAQLAKLQIELYLDEHLISSRFLTTIIGSQSATANAAPERMLSALPIHHET